MFCIHGKVNIWVSCTNAIKLQLVRSDLEDVGSVSLIDVNIACPHVCTNWIQLMQWDQLLFAFQVRGDHKSTVVHSQYWYGDYCV